MKYDINNISLRLAQEVSLRARQAWEDGTLLEQATPVTAELLRHWFCEPFVSERSMNFHEGQRQVILNIIYLHEVVRAATVVDFYKEILPGELSLVDLSTLAQAKYQLPKYAVKMATGTGKTWVMHALLLWQLLNARHETTRSGRYTQRFLIVAPGLIVYDRLRDAYLGRPDSTGRRRAETGDLHRYQDLFVPPQYREEVFHFVATNTVTKEEGIGRKATGEGMIAITNWHLFIERETPAQDAEEEFTPEEQEELMTLLNDEQLMAPTTATPTAEQAAQLRRIAELLPHTTEDYDRVGDSVISLRPGTNSGNSLDTLDGRYLRGTEMEYLHDLHDLMVINDEAHHVHETKNEGEVEEVQWQRALNYILEGKQALQVDFSATPYEQQGGRKGGRRYFPHIVVDYGLVQAMRKGLVKNLLLVKRQELEDLESLDYSAVREGRNVVALSDGQELMLRAGLKKLRHLEQEFATHDATKRPKMLVMCEDTKVTPFVEAFLRREGLKEEDILRVDSNNKGDMSAEEWARVSERLTNMDAYEHPRVVVSVLMLREGFDVNNICVIVPLRSAGSDILLEQTIGRGLRLMWRDPEYGEMKAESRHAIFVEGREPQSYMDMLSIVEHPRFIQFYEELMQEGVARIDDSTEREGNSLGDMVMAELKPDYQAYDMEWIAIEHESDEELQPEEIDVEALHVFDYFSLDQLRSMLVTHGTTFVQQSMLVATTFGKYTVRDDINEAQVYNEYLQKLYHVIIYRQARGLPMLQVGADRVMRTLDNYIRTRLFGEPFDPLAHDDWKILLAQNGIVTQFIVKEMATVLYHMQQRVQATEAEVLATPFSTVPRLPMRESYSLPLRKTIYTRTPFPTHGGGLEKAFMEYVDGDSEVLRWLKVSETRHRFASLYYLRSDGLLATYHPDFLVGTAGHVYMVETKGADKVQDANVLRKRQAAVEWCHKLNELPDTLRGGHMWEYLLVGETDFYALAANGATFGDLVQRCRVSSSMVRSELF